jgi:hypothetical protein
MIALGTALLAEVADVAGGAFIDGVGDERGSLAERLSQERFLQVWQSGVAQAEGALAADVRNAKLALTCVLRRDGSDSGLYRQFVNGARRSRVLVWGTQGV